MKNKKVDFDISFWREETETDFYKFQNYLKEHSNLENCEINKLLEDIYYSVSREYGD